MDYEAYGKKAALRVEKFTRIAKDPAIALRASEIGSYIEPEEATGINNFRNIHSNFLERECSELSGSLGLRFEQPRTLEESRRIIDGISSAIATIADADNKRLLIAALKKWAQFNSDTNQIQCKEAAFFLSHSSVPVLPICIEIAFILAALALAGNYFFRMVGAIVGIAIAVGLIPLQIRRISVALARERERLLAEQGIYAARLPASLDFAKRMEEFYEAELSKRGQI